MKGGWDPKVTEELFYEVDGIFKGPVGLPELVGKLPGPRLPIDLRPDLDVYANIRPCRLRPGAPADGKKRLTCACKWGMCKGDDLFKETFTEVAEGYKLDTRGQGGVQESSRRRSPRWRRVTQTSRPTTHGLTLGPTGPS